MKRALESVTGIFVVALVISAPRASAQVGETMVNSLPRELPSSELGALVGEQYQGDGLSIRGDSHGVRLVLPSGRRISYSRLHVTDATGRELSARIEVGSASLLRVFVEDASAAYPVRIDPTFSDDNWISMGGLSGVDWRVSALAVDVSGNLYVAGHFSIAGDILANRIAKWDGTNWSALGSGTDQPVLALAVSGHDVYAGGVFTSAGGIAANYVARWDGMKWSALGTGMNGTVRALAVSSGTLYAGGEFTATGAVSANRVAEWDGTQWRAMGSGVEGGA